MGKTVKDVAEMQREWLQSNNKTLSEVQTQAYAVGFVVLWIERAEAAEAARGELVAACKAALGMVDKDDPMDFDDAMAECERVTLLCKSAISKAEGQE
jgi:hypothetical protein